MNIKKITAAIAAAALAASVSICAFAEDVSTEGVPFEWTVENAGAADGYTNEAKAVINYVDNDVAYSDIKYYDGAIEGVLADNTVITVDSGTEAIADITYAFFEFYNFSADGTTLEEKYGFCNHSHTGGGCFCWAVNGTDYQGDPIVSTETINGYDVNVCGFDCVTVLGNKINGELIRRIYDDYAAEYAALDEVQFPDFDEFDVVMVGLQYRTSDNLTRRNRLCFLTDSYAKGSSAASNPTTPETPAEGTYKVTADKPFTDEEFAAILEQNKTKDVEITANGVTYTFKKGEMEAVEGAVYDFGATVTTDLSKLENPDKALNEDNFVLHIDYNYSGKLPAKAAIKLNVGKDYAGETLYYSQISENGIKFVQSVKVDTDGYITVTQDHCSEYVLTTEDVTKTSGGASADNDSTGAASTDSTSTADSAGKENPDTGMSGLTAAIGAMALAGAVIFTASRKRK